MDELHNIRWFSTWDLCAGFHQILLHAGKEHKTSCQTHLDRVMAFGLTGVPGTFQGELNATLALGLRKFVLIFFMIFWCIVNHWRNTLVIFAKFFSGCEQINGNWRCLSANSPMNLFLTWGTLFQPPESLLTQPRFKQLLTSQPHPLSRIYRAF